MALDNVDELVVKTVFKDGGAVKGLSSIEKGQKNVISGNKKVISSQTELKKSTFSLANAFKAFSVILLGKEILKSAVDMSSLNSAFIAIAGSARKGAQEIKFLKKEADRLGLDFSSVARSYKGFFASSMGAGMNVDFTRALFSSLMEAGTALQARPEEMERALLAISQMISKGKVSAEELRQQLGDALPGAVQIAAKALGVTTQEFEKLMEKGLESVSFLKKFEEQLKKTYGNKWIEGARSLQAEINRLSNAFFELKVALVSGGALSALTNGIKALTGVIKFLSNNVIEISVLLVAVFMPKIRLLIPMVNLFFVHLATGAGVLASLKYAFVASIPAMKAFTVAAWASVAPFLRLLAVVELVIQAIKMIKGEWNMFAEGIDLIERGTWKFLDKLTGKNKYKNFKGSFSQGDYTGYFSDVDPEMRGVPLQGVRKATGVNQTNANVNQSVVFNINGAKDSKAVADEIDRIVTNKLALGVLQ